MIGCHRGVAVISGGESGGPNSRSGYAIPQFSVRNNPGGSYASGRVAVAKAIRRNKLLEFFASLPPCLVGLEACGSAHHWARELIKLGHDARMMPPA